MTELRRRLIRLYSTQRSGDTLSSWHRRIVSHFRSGTHESSLFPMNPRIALATLLVVLCAGLVACSSSHDGSTGGNANNAAGGGATEVPAELLQQFETAKTAPGCQFLTWAEVSAAVGLPVTHNRGGEDFYCSWGFDPLRAPIGDHLVVLEVKRVGDGYASRVRDLQTAANFTSGSVISGLGTQAYCGEAKEPTSPASDEWQEGQATSGATLYVRVRDVTYGDVLMTMTGSKETCNNLVPLARLAYPRINFRRV